ncbi:MAG: TIGR03960 family B12-binding radical SAM protein [Raoultibacter sp.]
MTDLWPRLEALLPAVQRPARYINHEWGTTYKPEAAYRFCMVYPDTYELGQANQAIRILCNVVNACEGMAAERVFLPAPEFCDTLRAQNLPLFSVESCAPVAEFDCVGITLPHELAATNVLETLDLAGIPLHAAARGEDDPLVFAGGPCAFNPEPYAPFFDAFSLGEGEQAVVEMLKLHRQLRAQGATRSEIVHALAQLPGCYVPALYDWRDEASAQAAGTWISPREEGLPVVFEKSLFDGFAQSPAWEPCVVPFTEVVHDRLNVEILRGCTRGCRFCQAGMMYRPVRERSADSIVEAVLTGLDQTGYDEVGLTSLSSTDHSQIAEILTRLNKACDEKGISVSIPSQRLDAFGVDMATLVAGRKRGGLTFAPEAGTQRLRDVINKNVTEEDLFNAVDAAFAAGWRRCKLYFMIGLPTETDEDIRGIASLAQRTYNHMKQAVPPDQRGHIKLGISAALFVPKSQTPFQWDGQLAPEEAQRRVNLLRSSVKTRAIDVNWHDPATSCVEAVMSRGGRECAAWVEQAWARGARFDAWSECFKAEAWADAAAALGLDTAAVAQTTYDTSYTLPWEHISAGVTPAFLRRERALAATGTLTPDCSFDECSACGVCQSLGVAVQTQEVRCG